VRRVVARLGSTAPAGNERHRAGIAAPGAHRLGDHADVN